MKLYDYSHQHAEAGECPFRGEFADNHWIAYHGTKSLFGGRKIKI